MSKIIVYTTPSCVYCKMAKRYLDDHKIAYTERDVAADENALREMESKSHQIGVPVIEIDGEVFVGFNRKAIAEKLGIR